jgi:predicted lipoprotein with Yx(FWY)xxD motif
MVKIGAIAFSATLLAATIALAQTAPTKTGDSTKGKVLTDGKGMTLYIFDKDDGGKSASNWPPLMASANAKPTGAYTIVSRDDGGKQWAYKGKPLYTWAKDTKPGDVTGDGVNNVWHIATP